MVVITFHQFVEQNYLKKKKSRTVICKSRCCSFGRFFFIEIDFRRLFFHGEVDVRHFIIE